MSAGQRIGGKAISILWTAAAPIAFLATAGIAATDPSARTANATTDERAANDQPAFAAAPAWVVPAAPVDLTKLGPATPVLLQFDQQHRIDGSLSTQYSHNLIYVSSAQILQQAGTITLPWQPAHGRLTIHGVQILRGAERIDVLATGGKFQVLRREERLGQLEMNGVLTATLAVEGLRVGDVLSVAASVTVDDRALGGRAQALVPLLQAPVQAGTARARLSWPAGQKVAWKGHGGTPAVTRAGGDEVVEIAGLLAKAPDLPKDAPKRLQPVTLLEATSFSGWGDVAAIMAPHYATDGLIANGSPLAAEVAKIRAASTDPRTRAAMALRLVQDEVRYLFQGMDGGNYMPQKPADTWQLRYGDCKAKTLMLLAMLHALDIEADAALVHSSLGGALPSRLPSPAAFDHVIVRAKVGGETLWLDGTRRGDRLADLGDRPPFVHALPLTAQTNALVAIAPAAPARPDFDIAIDMDQRAGLTLPAAARLTLLVRGQLAENLNTAWGQANPEQKVEIGNSIFTPFVGDAMVVDPQVAWDAEAGVLRVTGRAVVATPWSITNERMRLTLDRAVGGIEFAPDRARAAWRDIPVATDDPGGMIIRTRMTLPGGGRGYALEGDSSVPAQLAGYTLRRTAALDGAVVTAEDHLFSTGAEIAPADIAAERTRVAAAKAKLLRVVAPADAPARWAEVEAAEKAGTLRPLRELYATSVAGAQPLVARRNRASFLSGIYDWKGAIADLDAVIDEQPDAGTLTWRAWMHSATGDDAKAEADYRAAVLLDPDTLGTVRALANHLGETGKTDEALGIVDARIEAGGREAADYLATRANILANAGRADEALADLDQANEKRPGDADLLNSRCWLKGTMQVAIDSALRDCTRAIELAESPASALDSRAMVYFRMGRLDEARADLNAAIEMAPDMANAWYLRGVVMSHAGDRAGGARQIAAAKRMAPRVGEDYDRWGVKP